MRPRASSPSRTTAVPRSSDCDSRGKASAPASTGFATETPRHRAVNASRAAAFSPRPPDVVTCGAFRYQPARLSHSLLSASSISKAFEGVSALRGVSFDLKAGEVHALVGENGAGKSTLIKIMTGAEQPDAGTLTVVGRAVPHMTPALARSLGIAAIYQQPSL